MKRLKKVPTKSPLVFVGTQSLSKLYDLHVQKLILLGWEELRKMGGYRSDEKMLQVLINLIDALTPESVVFFMERKNKINIDNYLERSSFYRNELGKRKDADFPPYRRVFSVEVEKKSKDAADKTIKKIKDILQEDGIGNCASSGALLEKKTQYRWRLILRGDEELLRKALFRIYDLPEVQIEADPLYI